MAQAIINEIDSVKSFLNARPSDEANCATNEALKKNFTAALVQQVNSCLSLHKADATLVVDALKDSPYGDVNTKRILAAIDAKVIHNASAATAATGVKDQFLKTWWNMCTQDDWDWFKDPKRSFYQKLTKLVDRGNLLGCNHPDEQTLKWMLAMLLMTHYGDMPSAAIIYEKLQELKQIVAAERKASPLEQLQSFPNTPSELPKDIYSYAYSDGDPIAVELPGVNAIADKISLRSNNRLLKKSPIKQQQPPAGIHIKPKFEQPMINVSDGEASGSAAMIHGQLHDMPVIGDHVEEQLYTK